jgi:hypothetical protein
MPALCLPIFRVGIAEFFEILPPKVITPTTARLRGDARIIFEGITFPDLNKGTEESGRRQTFLRWRRVPVPPTSEAEETLGRFST